MNLRKRFFFVDKLEISAPPYNFGIKKKLILIKNKKFCPAQIKDNF